MRECVTPSFVHERGDEVEISIENVNRIDLILGKPLEKVREEYFLNRELRTIDIGDPSMNIGANRVKMS